MKLIFKNHNFEVVESNDLANHFLANKQKPLTFQYSFYKVEKLNNNDGCHSKDLDNCQEK